jgi:hypothetical protein
MEGRGSKRPRKAVLAARYRVTGEEAKQKISILQNFTLLKKLISAQCRWKIPPKKLAMIEGHHRKRLRGKTMTGSYAMPLGDIYQRIFASLDVSTQSSPAERAYIERIRAAAIRSRTMVGGVVTQSIGRDAFKCSHNVLSEIFCANTEVSHCLMRVIGDTVTLHDFAIWAGSEVGTGGDESDRSGLVQHFADDLAASCAIVESRLHLPAPPPSHADVATLFEGGEDAPEPAFNYFDSDGGEIIPEYTPDGTPDSYLLGALERDPQHDEFKKGVDAVRESARANEQRQQEGERLEEERMRFLDSLPEPSEAEKQERAALHEKYDKQSEQRNAACARCRAKKRAQKAELDALLTRAKEAALGGRPLSEDEKRRLDELLEMERARKSRQNKKSQERT